MGIDAYDKYLDMNKVKTYRAPRAYKKKNDVVIEKLQEKSKLLRMYDAAELATEKDIIKKYNCADIFVKLAKVIDHTKENPNPEKCLLQIGWMWDLIASPKPVRWLALKKLLDMEMYIREKDGRHPLDDPMPSFENELEDLTFLQHVKRILMT